jgi:hypothetical protein
MTIWRIFFPSHIRLGHTLWRNKGANTKDWSLDRRIFSMISNFKSSFQKGR